MTRAFGSVAVTGVERISRHERHILLEGSFEKTVAIHASRKRDPQEEPAQRTSPAYFRWTKFFKRIEHHISALAIDTADQFYVFIEKSIPRHLIGNHLGKRRCVQIGSLLELHEF